MILHFHAADTKPGEIDRINIDFDRQNYNCDDYPESQYIEVNREDLFKILQECDFNAYWYNQDLTAAHNQTLNSMCKDCSHLNKSCPGTASDVWTGCILKDRPEDEAKDYIDKMTEIFEREQDNDRRKTEETATPGSPTG